MVKIRYTSPGSLENLQVKIYDVIGKIISQPTLVQIEEGLFEYKMNLVDIAGGVYIVRVTDENEVFIQRFVKIK